MKNFNLILLTIASLVLLFNKTVAEIPAVYQNLYYSGDTLYFKNSVTGKDIPRRFIKSAITIDNVKNPAKGTDNGIIFDFKQPNLNGILYYGLYQKNGEFSKYPIYLNTFSVIKNGIAEINIAKNLAGKRDISNWSNDGLGKIGYRVVDSAGKILYDGKLNFLGTGPFEVPAYISEGPFINCVTDSTAIVSIKTNVKYNPIIEINGKTINCDSAEEHEILLTGLKQDTEYKYSITYGKFKETFSFRTNFKKGTRKPISFAFSSDSRTGFGGGERDLNGVNSYIMKKSAAFASFSNVNFFLFTGDMITGYLTSYQETLLQYANWKRTIEPYSSSIPFYVGMGNHENVVCNFDDGSLWGISINSFPFESSSSESAFMESFVNFNNGPKSEDNSKYDKNPDKADFPPYDEQVFHFTNGNIAVVVLNSNYLYSASKSAMEHIGGNPHAFIMDNQIKWFEKVIKQYDSDNDIDHIFVTIHTPAFPNGGHAHDAMWYLGSNSPRPLLFGEKTNTGIIERRDEFLDIMCNQTNKVVALLTGDEHNYSRMKINSAMTKYPENWTNKKLNIKNPIWQIVNGAAGAPYYGQEELPWSANVEKFTAEHIICIFKIDGKKVDLEVFNPETLELVEKVNLKK